MDSTLTINILNNTFKTFCLIKKCNYGRKKGMASEKKGNIENYKFINF